MLAWLPTREFLKITFMLGIPFIFALAIMARRKRYSLSWILSLLLMLVIVGAYVYLLTDLPDRIQTRRIITQGASLVAQGKYDQAISEYRKLAPLGHRDKMNEKIAVAEKEKKAEQQLKQAKSLLQQGRTEEARATIKTIDSSTRAGIEAQKLLKQLDKP
jgi:sensor histidine kinase YesM